MIPFIPSPNYYAGRRAPLKWVVWHSTEGAETTGAAERLARGWFGVPTSRVSAHVVADAGALIECVKPGDTAWHCARGNSSGYGVEVVGRAAQTTVDWNDAYSLAALDRACRWVRDSRELEHIPPRWLSDADLKAGMSGHITHYQVSKVLGGTTHTDPGAAFPYGYVMDQLGARPAPVPTLSRPAAVGALPTLRYGETSPAVRHLQEFLVRTFPSYNGYTPTGFYGDKTKAGLAEFQARAGVQGSPLDGSIVGPATNSALARFGYR